MEAFTTHQFPPKPKCLMTFKFPSLRHPAFLRFSAAFSTEPATLPILEPRTKRVIKKVNLDTAQLKLDWLQSLSGANPDKVGIFDANLDKVDANSSWVIGIDPDLSGALAVLKPDNSAQVYDAPFLKVLVGSRIRKRLDAKSITQLLQTIEAPIGTTAYIEQSIPFPHDGKQGWWSGGFGYGLWIGILVASGYNVVPVSSMLWKNEFKLAGSRTSKDDSRELASTLFPTMSTLLKRKKDHGRAEALLIAGYGKGVKAKFSPSCAVEEDNNLPNLSQKQDIQVADEKDNNLPNVSQKQDIQAADEEDNNLPNLPQKQDIQAACMLHT